VPDLRNIACRSLFHLLQSRITPRCPARRVGVLIWSKIMMRFLTGASLALALIAFSACTGDSDGESPLSPSPIGSLTIDHITNSVSSGDVQGLRRQGTAPASGAGPNITATANQTVLTGGTQTIAITGDSPFTTVYIAVGGRSLGLVGEAPGGISGYYEVTLGAATIATSVILTFPQEVPLTEFDLQVAVANATGVLGPYVPVHTTVLGVGTGDVQVTLAWDADSDVDLHVVGPDGEEIFYGNRDSASGGELDLDSNAGCEIDGIRNENITWPVGTAPRGTYTVRVNYWSSCGVAQTNYTVRVNNGGAVEIFTGSFTGGGNQGGRGDGVVITTFERTSGPTAMSPAAIKPPGNPLTGVSPLKGKVQR
jgi:hypothetical protein